VLLLAKMLLKRVPKVWVFPKRASIPVTDDRIVSGSYTSVGGILRIRIVKPPNSRDCDLEGFDVSRFAVGQVYEVGLRLGELLIVCGYAEPEMRQRDRAADQPI
jgi:hypothetical protein